MLDYQRREAPEHPTRLLRLATSATELDRAADLELARGHAALAERLANRALELREVAR